MRRLHRYILAFCFIYIDRECNLYDMIGSPAGLDVYEKRLTICP